MAFVVIDTLERRFGAAHTDTLPEPGHLATARIRRLRHRLLRRRWRRENFALASRFWFRLRLGSLLDFFLTPVFVSHATKHDTEGPRLKRAKAIGGARYSERTMTSSARPLCRVAVFCGSAFGNNPAFRAEATALGATIAQAGLGLVYGGACRGLMGGVAQPLLRPAKSWTRFCLAVMKRRRTAALRYPPYFGIRLGRLRSQSSELF